MLGNVTLKITGAEAMEKSLREFGPKVSRNLGGKALRAGARPVVNEAKRLVPVRTGELRKSIVAIMGKAESNDERTVLVGFRRPTASRAHFTEFGTVFQPAQPFLRPAFDTQAQAAIDAISASLEKGIARKEYLRDVVDTAELIEGI